MTLDGDGEVLVVGTSDGRIQRVYKLCSWARDLSDAAHSRDEAPVPASAMAYQTPFLLSMRIESCLLLQKMKSELRDMSYSIFNSSSALMYYMETHRTYGFDEFKEACYGIELPRVFACLPISEQSLTFGRHNETIKRGMIL